jgi:hypothetical protein
MHTPVELIGLTDANYNTIAASQTAQVLSLRQGETSGKVGDYLAGLLIVPTTTAAAAVTITDGSNSATTIFAGATVTALLTLIPFFVPICARSKSGAWKVTTLANVSVLAVGKFS